MKILLTGATGFVGRNLLLRLLEDDRYDKIIAPVRGVGRLEAQLHNEGFKSIPKKLVPIEGNSENWNIRDWGDCDHVVHSAGVIFATTWDEYSDVNIGGTERLLNELRTPKRTVILSSLAASGPNEEAEPREEGDADSPVTWYGRSKLEMEKRVLLKFPHLKPCFLRPPMIFGPRDHATLPLFLMARKPIRFKAGLKKKHYSVLGVQDLCDAILSVLWDSSERPYLPYYFVAHSEVITDLDIIEGAGKLIGKKGIILPVPQPLLKIASRLVSTIPTWRATIPSLSVDRAKEIWPARWVVSSRAFSDRFSWKPQESFEAALESTYHWYRQQNPSLAS